MAVYATVQQLTDWMAPTTPPANAAAMLRRASRDVDRALLTSVYDITKTATATALQEATCEQVVGNLDSGDRSGTGAAPPTSGFTIGKLSVQRGGVGAAGSALQNTKIGPLWQQAWVILQLAGLTGHEPQAPDELG